MQASLGDISKPLTAYREEELEAIAEALGLDLEILATMSREDKIVLIERQRESALRAAAAAAGIAGAETMPTAQLFAALQAKGDSAGFGSDSARPLLPPEERADKKGVPERAGRDGSRAGAREEVGAERLRDERRERFDGGSSRGRRAEDDRDEELAAVMEALGVDPETLATMSREDMISFVGRQRESALRSAAASAGLAGAETMPRAELLAALQATEDSTASDRARSPLSREEREDKGYQRPSTVDRKAERAVRDGARTRTTEDAIAGAQQAGESARSGGISGRGREKDTAISGGISKPLTTYSDEELDSIAEALGIDFEILATMSREDKIAFIERQRESARKAGKGGKDKVQRLSADGRGMDLAELQILHSIPNVSKGQGEGTHDGLGLAAPLDSHQKYD